MPTSAGTSVAWLGAALLVGWALRALALPGVPYPRSHWQVPEEWRTGLPPDFTMSAYGYLLGLGFATDVVLPAYRSPCHRERVAARPMRVCRVIPHEEGGGINGGHIAYVWRDRGTAFVISLHGYRNRPRARAMIRALVETVVTS